MNTPSRAALLLLLLAGTLSNTACEGLGGAIIGEIPRQVREAERREQEREGREKERKRTEELLAILAKKDQDFDAGLALLKGLAVQGEEELEAANARWKALQKETLDVPAEVRRPVKIYGKPDHQAFQKEVLVPRHEAYVALRKRVHAARVPTIRLLIRKGIAGNAPRWSRTLLHRLYNTDVNTKDESLRALAREIGKQYDADLLARFKKYGGYGKLNASGNRTGCVFSSKPWPKKLGAVRPRFQTHFKGKGIVVHVLGRLPLPAHHYGDRTAGKLTVQLIAQNHGFVDVGESVFVGKPKLLGDTPYVRAAFELPPRRFDHSRYFFDVRVLLSWQDGRGRWHRRNLSQSSFTWQRD